MKQKIFIHIGLPKTATTSLQKDLFPQLKNTKYLGISYPRTWEYDPSTVYGAFMLGMHSGDNQQFKAALDQLDPLQNVLISEEMITVVTGSADWERNLKNVHSLLRDYDYRLLVTIRDPLDAMFSYYVERYDYFRKALGEFDERVIKSLDMGIYRYKSFFQFLGDEFGSERIFVADYENIISGQFFEIEKFLGERLPTDLAIRKHNNKAQKASKIYVNNKGSLYSIVSDFVKTRLHSGSLRSCARGLERFVKPVLELVSWDRGVPLLSDQQKQKFRTLLVEDIQERQKLIR